MFPPDAAAAARREGIDAVAVQEFDELCGLGDVDLFTIAQLDRRVLVTENARDFAPIEAAWPADASHYGLVLTSNRSFPRHNPPRFIRDIVAALAAFDLQTPATTRTFVIWLRPV